VLGLSGECDVATRHQLENALAQALSARGLEPLILDLSTLEFCDVGCTRMVCEAGRQGRVALAGLSGTVGKVFGLLDPDHWVPRYDDVSDALASFSANRGQPERGT
jgi:anti-anti-sigma factor